MAKSDNQKMKMVTLVDILKRYTDDDHGLTCNEIIEYLGKKDIKAERKSIYDDFNTLRSFGYEIEKFQDKGTRYKIIDDSFEISELKLLVDAVQSSKFISEAKTKILIDKLTELTSVYNASQLKREVKIANRVKQANEYGLYAADTIHAAMNKGKKITFQYYEWSSSKELVAKHDGKRYKVSPWSLVWDDENYYLVAFEDETGIMKHFRVDKIRSCYITEENREGRKAFQEQSNQLDANRYFGMFHGDLCTVTLRCSNSLIGVMIDRFGKRVTFIPRNDDCFDVIVRVVVSQNFFGWLSNFGSDVKIISPQNIADEYRQSLEKILDLYK